MTSSTAPEEAFRRSSRRDVGVGGVMIHQTLQVALCPSKPHSDAVFSCSVAAFGQTADLILLDVQPERRRRFNLLHLGTFSPTNKHEWMCHLYLWRGKLAVSIQVTYTTHGIPPISTLTSLGCPVLSLRPLMVREEPPAFGPLWGKMLLSTGSWWWRRRETEGAGCKDERAR